MVKHLALPYFFCIFAKKINMELDLIIYALLLMFALQCILILIVGLVLKNKLNDIEHTINDVLLEYERAIYRKL